MAKKKKRLTKREKKELTGGPRGPNPAPTPQGAHLHCIACGRHINSGELQGALATATILTCQHGGRFPSCTKCTAQSQALIDEHDRTNTEVRAAAAWH